MSFSIILHAYNEDYHLLSDKDLNDVTVCPIQIIDFLWAYGNRGYEDEKRMKKGCGEYLAIDQKVYVLDFHTT